MKVSHAVTLVARKGMEATKATVTLQGQWPQSKNLDFLLLLLLCTHSFANKEDFTK